MKYLFLLSGWQPSKYSRICSLHFSPTDFDQQSRLLPSAVPVSIRPTSDALISDHNYAMPDAQEELAKRDRMQDTLKIMDKKVTTLNRKKRRLEGQLETLSSKLHELKDTLSDSGFYKLNSLVSDIPSGQRFSISCLHFL